MAKKSKASDASATPATVALTNAAISFTTHHYEPDASASSKGMGVANALGLDQSVVFKTLLATIAAIAKP